MRWRSAWLTRWPLPRACGRCYAPAHRGAPRTPPRRHGAGADSPWMGDHQPGPDRATACCSPPERRPVARGRLWLPWTHKNTASRQTGTQSPGRLTDPLIQNGSWPPGCCRPGWTRSPDRRPLWPASARRPRGRGCGCGAGPQRRHRQARGENPPRPELGSEHQRLDAECRADRGFTQKCVFLLMRGTRAKRKLTPCSVMSEQGHNGRRT